MAVRAAGPVQLHPGLRTAPVQHVAMGLGPSFPGRAMVEDSLSHVLSVVQALVPIDGAAGATAVTQSYLGAAATANVLRFELAGATGPVAVELHLQQCPAQPRPAWLAVNGCRMDRRIGAGYAQSFVAGDKSVPVAYSRTPGDRFTSLLAHRLAPIRELAESLAVRIHCQASALPPLDRGS